MLKHDQGFTLIEIIAVLFIMSIVAGIVVVKFDVFNRGSTEKLSQIVIADLNEREKLAWTNLKLGDGWESDELFFEAAKADGIYDIGKSKWQLGPDQAGGTLILNGNAVKFARTVSESTHPGQWRKL